MGQGRTGHRRADPRVPAAKSSTRTTSAAYIRYRQRVTAASWSSDTRQWTVEVTRADTGERLRYTADFVWMCQGYYRQDEGYTPQWPGMEQFAGRSSTR